MLPAPNFAVCAWLLTYVFRTVKVEENVNWNYRKETFIFRCDVIDKAIAKSSAAQAIAVALTIAL